MTESLHIVPKLISEHHQPQQFSVITALQDLAWALVEDRGTCRKYQDLA